MNLFEGSRSSSGIPEAEMSPAHKANDTIDVLIAELVFSALQDVRSLPQTHDNRANPS